MKTIAALIALALAVPAAAQTAPAPDSKPKMLCCCKDKPMACCEEHGKAGKPPRDEHEGHDMAQPQS